MEGKDGPAKLRKRIAEIIEIGNAGDWMSRGYDILSTVVLLVNLASTILYTFDDMELRYGSLLLSVEAVTVAFFALDYCLRIWTAQARDAEDTRPRATLRYALSPTGLIDLLSFLPYYLPIFFPAGAAVFRMFRVIRIFRMFRINAYYDALNVIVEVISSKRQQLVSSVCMLLVLLLAASLCMYSVENRAQPEVFENAFSGIWWAVSTLLTVGYGDIYPITTMGRVISIVLTFLGVGMVAIPTGIISAGFVEQYSRVKRIGEYAQEQDIQFIKFRLQAKDTWVEKEIRDLDLPRGVIVAMLRRGRENIIPRGDMRLRDGDTLVLGAEALKDDVHIDLKELILLRHHPWVGRAVRDLDISRQTLLVMVKRKGGMLIPRGDLVLREGDHVILYTQAHIGNANEILL